jgi:hypothetical protein
MFGQNPEKMIIVVAPKKYKAVARELTHEISKLENCNAASWTIKQFEDNEMQIGSKHWVLSLGNPKENQLTSDYTNFISLKHKEGGLCYGFDGNKAVVFADEKLVDKKKTVSVAQKLNLLTSDGVATGAVSSAFITGRLAFRVLLALLPTILITSYFYKKKIVEKLLKATTPLTADLFLNQGVKEWLKINEGTDSK